MRFPGNPRLSSRTGENARGIHNSHSLDNPGVTDLQVRQARWGGGGQATWPRPEAAEARPAWDQLPAPCRGLPAPRKGRPQRRGQREGRGREQHCVTPSSTFPARPATAGVPETREASSSKTSSSGKPKAWELKPRPKPRVARRQRDWVREMSLGRCHSHHSFLPPPIPLPMH